MTFLPREIFAYISHKKSPTTSNPLILAIFGGVFVAMTLSPFDIFYKLTRLLYYFLGILQGINQTRLYTLILRTTQILGNRSLVIALTFATMDQVLEIITRPLLGGQETRMSNITTVIRNLIFSSVYYASTHKTPFTKYIGYHRHYIPALILAFITGTSNATAAFNLRTPVTQQTHPTQHVEEDKNEEEEEKEKKPKVEIVDE
ncbi:hypothetical protein GPJ56_007507 [Histomonas meleagridis]|uniref:uncharacterized protein n=1 Tax=Histomonas meleagridis TaxID=135588 RepID=UPI00355A62BD|nr:hypothetical protein GPJ56_007507 [Histomonas meleagridis]KAH0804353.1 hypothetical protein GO595_003183 [Histomonas meleagridis]